MEKFLSPTDRQQLEAAYSVTSNKRDCNKINIILLKDDGYPVEEITTILRLHQSTVSRHLKAYKALGYLKYLKNPFSGGICKLEVAEIEKLEKYLDETLCESTDEVIKFVKDNFNKKYSRSGMSALLKKLGFVFKKPVLIPGKADTETQEAFVEYFTAIKASMTPKDKMYFIDGVHPQHNTIASFGWIRKGKEKQLKTNTGRKRLNLNGALDSETGEIIVRADKTLNAQSTIELMKMIEDQNKGARKIALIVDNRLFA